MPDMVDASTLSDERRVRRTELAAAHTAALRLTDEGDRKAELAKVEKAIKAEYAEDPAPAQASGDKDK